MNLLEMYNVILSSKNETVRNKSIRKFVFMNIKQISEQEFLQYYIETNLFSWLMSHFYEREITKANIGTGWDKKYERMNGTNEGKIRANEGKIWSNEGQCRLMKGKYERMMENMVC